MILLYIALMLFGLFMLLLPQYFWMLTEQWKSEDATEPSTIFIGSTRFGGVMCTIVGCLGLIFGR